MRAHPYNTKKHTNTLTDFLTDTRHIQVVYQHEKGVAEKGIYDGCKEGSNHDVDDGTTANIEMW